MQLDLQGKRVLVTGGNSGLGEAIACAFAQEGAHVAINYRSRPEDTDRLVKEFLALGGKAVGIHADLVDSAAVEAMFARLDEEWGGIDVLVNNAGVDGPSAKGWEADPAEWSQVLDINLNGAFLCSRQALKRMVPQRSGVVINISSVHELIPWSGYSAYTASKAGLSMMAKTLAQEAAPYGVRVLSIAPGAIKTDINREVWEDEEGRRDLLQKIPLGRIGTPEDVAGMAVVLASKVAGYVTGSTVFIDGGMIDYPDFAHGG